MVTLRAPAAALEIASEQVQFTPRVVYDGRVGVGIDVSQGP